jgi:hypothetical protein
MNTILALVLIASVISIIVLPLLAYGQGSSFSSFSGSNDTMKKQTSGGTLDIILQSFPKRLRVQFLTQGTGTVQPHTDYDLTIKDNSGKTSMLYVENHLGKSNPMSWKHEEWMNYLFEKNR